jgi:uncharacterized protein involved in oxidation of intracellular sulfur
MNRWGCPLLDIVVERKRPPCGANGGDMKNLFIIYSDDGETIYNAMRLANVGVKKGDEVSVFMLGKGVLFEKSGTEQFNVMEEINKFEGDFYV